MSDPISDFLTRIRNAQMARKDTVEAPYSLKKERIARTMLKNGFLKSVEKDVSGKHPVLRVGLAEKSITLKRVSKPGQKIYVKAAEIKKVTNGFGIAIVSTSKGVMTGYEARSLKVGGELLCEVS